MTKQQVIDTVNYWYQFESSRIFVISGYAGCGKTTIARKIPDLLNLIHYAFLAPTGKVSNLIKELFFFSFNS